MAVRGQLSFPGDKSISHRTLMIGALANGQSVINNLATGLDVQSTITCLQNCGVSISGDESVVRINGSGLHAPTVPLDCGNSGTTMRLLTGLLAGRTIPATLIGDESLMSRPMDRIIDPLTTMGARISSRDGAAPLSIKSAELHGISYPLPVPSAQVKSALLLAGLGAAGMTRIHEPVKTRDHTEIMLRQCGVPVTQNNSYISISKLDHPLNPIEMTIPGDISTAAFFIIAAVLVPGSDLVIRGLSRNPTRTGAIAVLEQMGANLECLDSWLERGEPVGDLRIQASRLTAMPLVGSLIPSIIDEIPILAIAATQAEGTTTVRNAGELRIKESDRIRLIVDNLRAMGANIQEKPDGFDITGPTTLHGANIHTGNDHRIAMAFSIAGLIADGPLTLDNPDCASVSFPGFYKYLEDALL